MSAQVLSDSKRPPSPCFPGAWPDLSAVLQNESSSASDPCQLDQVFDFQKRLSASLVHSETNDILRVGSNIRDKSVSMQALETVDTLCEATEKNDLSSVSTATYLNGAHTSLSADRILLLHRASDYSTTTQDSFHHRLNRSASSPVILFSLNDPCALPPYTSSLDGISSENNDTSFASTDPLQSMTSSFDTNLSSYGAPANSRDLACLLVPRPPIRLPALASINNARIIPPIDEDYFSYIPPRGRPLVSYRSFEDELHSYPASPMSRFSRRSSFDSRYLSQSSSPAVQPRSPVVQRPSFPITQNSSMGREPLDVRSSQNGERSNRPDVCASQAIESELSSPGLSTTARDVQAHIPGLPPTADAIPTVIKPLVMVQSTINTELFAPPLQLAPLVTVDDLDHDHLSGATSMQPESSTHQQSARRLHHSMSYQNLRPSRSLAAGNPEDVMSLQDALATAPPQVRSVANQVRAAPFHRNTHNLTPLLRLSDAPPQVRPGNLMDQIKSVSQRFKKRLMPGKSVKQASGPTLGLEQRAGSSTSHVASRLSDSFVACEYDSSGEMSSPPSPPGLAPRAMTVQGLLPTESNDETRRPPPIRSLSQGTGQASSSSPMLATTSMALAPESRTIDPVTAGGTSQSNQKRTKSSRRKSFSFSSTSWLPGAASF